MITQNEIDAFYEDVASLKLRFPNAAIVKATGEPKGNVSSYLNKKRKPTEDFLRRFYSVFSESLKKVSRGTFSQNEDIGPGNYQEKSDNKKYIELLERDRIMLEQMQKQMHEIISANLAELLVAQRLNRAQLTVLTDLGAKTLATVQKRNLEMVREETSKALNDVVARQLQADTPAGM
ncbi:MAG: hypothetical protein M9904_02445 [Chitinophagaceae bacterium]|nr:hypothetical protein [Chitinophagaceae bacterium]